ncbi:MAG: hypothetical protein JEZ06_13030 [Anaerolineaceae bacterium]|nr:hypothetical protein [Anaerolineaceae bacterium]
MKNQQFIVDTGLFTENNDFNNYHLDATIETITSTLNTIKEYRVFTNPNAPSWEGYIQEIFHIFGFRTEKLCDQIIALSEIGSSKTEPKVLVGLLKPDEIITDIDSIHLWGTQITKNLEEYNVDWGIITDGLQFKLISLSRKGVRSLYFWVNFSGIIEKERVDSFMTVYKVFTYIISGNRNAPNVKFKETKSRNRSVTPNTTRNTYLSSNTYIHQFSNLAINRNKKYWSEKTNFQAPHKPLLLLSVIDLYSEKFISDNMIKITHELQILFEKYWSTLQYTNRSGNIALPFFHLRSSSFWHLIPCPGQEIALKNTHQIDSLSQLKKLIIGSKLDNDLVILLQNKNQLNMLRAIIIQTYFSPTIFLDLLNQSGTSIQSYENGLQLATTWSKKSNDDGLISGYVKLNEFPNIPSQKYPTKHECVGYEYMSMVQLCNIAQANNRSRSSACIAFGGDNGNRPVIHERQARVFNSRKFVLVNAVNNYFSEVGIIW